MLAQPNLHFSVVIRIYTLDHAHVEGLKPACAVGRHGMMTTLLSLALSITLIFLVWLSVRHLKMSNRGVFRCDDLAVAAASTKWSNQHPNSSAVIHTTFVRVTNATRRRLPVKQLRPVLAPCSYYLHIAFSY